MKRKHTEWVRISIVINRVFLSVQYPKYVKNSYGSTTERQNKQNKKNLNKYFSKEDMHMFDKHRKRCSTSLAIRKMQTKTTIKYHFTPIRML